MSSKNNTKNGFTIIELMIAMAFVSILLVMIGALTMRIISMYQKGLSIKAVDSVGSSIISDVSGRILAAPNNPAKIVCKKYLSTSYNPNPDTSKCEQDGAFKYSFYQAYGQLTSIDGSTVANQYERVPMYGSFCTGKYSYLWNSGYLLNPKKYSVSNGFKSADLEIKKSDGSRLYKLNNVRLLRVIDTDQSICAQNVDKDYKYNGSQRQKTYNLVIKDGFDPEPTDLITETDEDLAVYDLRFFPKINHDLTRQSLYSGTLILGTVRGGVDITGNGDYCIKPSESLATDFNYCAINKFNFAVRATGELTVEERAGRRL